MHLTIHYYDVTVMYVTLNFKLFNALLSIDIGLPKYLLGEFCILYFSKPTFYKPHNNVIIVNS